MEPDVIIQGLFEEEAPSPARPALLWAAFVAAGVLGWLVFLSK